MKNIGTRIKQRRKELGLKQSDLAEAIGVTQSFVSMIENGINIPTIRTLSGIANVLNTTTAILSGNDEHNDFGEDTLQELRYMYDSSQYKDMLRLINHASGAEYFQNPQYRAHLLICKALAYTGLMDYPSAIEICTHLLERTQSINDRVFLAAVHGTMGKIHLSMNDIDSAHTHCMQAYLIIMYQPVTDNSKRIRREILIDLGMVNMYMGKFDEARYYLERVFGIIDNDVRNSVKSNAQILVVLADISYKQHNYSVAIQYAENALKHYRFIGDKNGQEEVKNYIKEYKRTTHNDGEEG